MVYKRFIKHLSINKKEYQIIGDVLKMEWEKINVFDAIAADYKSYFDERYGLIKNMTISISIVDKNNVDISYVYTKSSEECNKFIRLANHDINTFLQRNKKVMFETEFYKLNEEANQRGYYYGYNNPAETTLDKLKPIKDYKFKITIRYDYLGSIESRDRYGRTIQSIGDRNIFDMIYVSNEKELKNITILATKDMVREYICPIFANLKKGQKYYYITKGICVVNKVYEWKDENSSICNVSFSDGTKEDILPSDIRFVEIPMDYKNELEIFNESTNELFLQPLIKTKPEQNLINIMWQPIDEAARYVVKLYKTINVRGQKGVYFLKDYEVDRNEHWLAISSIIIDNHVIVITAENRSGEIIAKSKGMNVLTGKAAYCK